jgi:hypothetical protein
LTDDKQAAASVAELLTVGSAAEELAGRLLFPYPSPWLVDGIHDLHQKLAHESSDDHVEERIVCLWDYHANSLRTSCGNTLLVIPVLLIGDSSFRTD